MLYNGNLYTSIKSLNNAKLFSMSDILVLNDRTIEFCDLFYKNSKTDITLSLKEIRDKYFDESNNNNKINQEVSNDNQNNNNNNNNPIFEFNKQPMMEGSDNNNEPASQILVEALHSDESIVENFNNSIISLLPNKSTINQTMVNIIPLMSHDPCKKITENTYLMENITNIPIDKLDNNGYIAVITSSRTLTAITIKTGITTTNLVMEKFWGDLNPTGGELINTLTILDSENESSQVSRISDAQRSELPRSDIGSTNSLISTASVKTPPIQQANVIRPVTTIPVLSGPERQNNGMGLQQSRSSFWPITTISNSSKNSNMIVTPPPPIYLTGNNTVQQNWQIAGESLRNSLTNFNRPNMPSGKPINIINSNTPLSVPGLNKSQSSQVVIIDDSLSDSQQRKNIGEPQNVPEKPILLDSQDHIEPTNHIIGICDCDKCQKQLKKLKNMWKEKKRNKKKHKMEKKTGKQNNLKDFVAPIGPVSTKKDIRDLSPIIITDNSNAHVSSNPSDQASLDELHFRIGSRRLKPPLLTVDMINNYSFISSDCSYAPYGFGATGDFLSLLNSLSKPISKEQIDISKSENQGSLETIPGYNNGELTPIFCGYLGDLKRHFCNVPNLNTPPPPPPLCDPFDNDELFVDKLFEINFCPVNFPTNFRTTWFKRLSKIYKIKFAHDDFDDDKNLIYKINNIKRGDNVLNNSSNNNNNTNMFKYTRLKMSKKNPLWGGNDVFSDSQDEETSSISLTTTVTIPPNFNVIPLGLKLEEIYPTWAPTNVSLDLLQRMTWNSHGPNVLPLFGWHYLHMKLFSNPQSIFIERVKHVTSSISIGGVKDVHPLDHAFEYYSKEIDFYLNDNFYKPTIIIKGELIDTNTLDRALGRKMLSIGDESFFKSVLKIELKKTWLVLYKFYKLIKDHVELTFSTNSIDEKNERIKLMSSGCDLPPKILELASFESDSPYIPCFGHGSKFLKDLHHGDMNNYQKLISDPIRQYLVRNEAFNANNNDQCNFTCQKCALYLTLDKSNFKNYKPIYPKCEIVKNQ